jgi:hypothetical protein
MSDRELQKLIKGDVPYVEQLDLSPRFRHEQNLFDKCLSHLQVAESGAVGFQMKLPSNSLPVLRPNQHPGPFAQCLRVIAMKDWSQHFNLLLTLWDSVGANAHEFLSAGICQLNPDNVQVWVGLCLN